MAKVKVGKVWTKKKAAPEAVQTEVVKTETVENATTEQVEVQETKKPGWWKHGKKVLGGVAAVAGLVGAVVFGKKVKEYSDNWNEGQRELQGRFPDGDFTLTDEDGNSYSCKRQAFYGGGKDPSELLFWAEVPEQTDETGTET